MRNWKLFMLLGLVLWSLVPVWAETFTAPGHLILSTTREGDNVRFTLKSLATFDLTVTIEFTRLENMKANCRLPCTFTLPGGETICPLVISPGNPRKSYYYNFKYHFISGTMNASHDDNYVYTLPYQSGTKHLVGQGYDGKFSHFGNERFALDFHMPVGTPVLAARDGVVIGVKQDSNQGGSDVSFADFANFVMIRHLDGTTADYKHLRQNGAAVRVRQKVKVGDLLGYSGNTGHSTCPHLHFMVYKGVDGNTRQTFPTKFRTSRSSAEILLQGQTYTAP
ncbi:MAG: M23 family metallopeptidase [Candidatus Riflebacteria bacterium]|nr:M23 family metallopeptidase [Candidatus Riflebacteria bacterium]